MTDTERAIRDYIKQSASGQELVTVRGVTTENHREYVSALTIACMETYTHTGFVFFEGLLGHSHWCVRIPSRRGLA